VFLLRACGMAQWEKLRHRNIDSDRGHTCRGCGAPTTGKIKGRVRRRTFIALAGSPGPALLVRSSTRSCAASAQASRAKLTRTIDCG